jgi:glucose-6-phosphate 1-dehydrogenase
VAKIPPGVGPQHSQVVVLVGATGDLSRRKLLPGLFYLSSAGFIPGCRIIGVSLDQIDADGFRKIAREALDQFSSRKVMMMRERSTRPASANRRTADKAALGGTLR